MPTSVGVKMQTQVVDAFNARHWFPINSEIHPSSQASTSSSYKRYLSRQPSVVVHDPFSRFWPQQQPQARLRL